MALAASGQQSCRLTVLLGDVLIAVEPIPRLIDQFKQEGDAGKGLWELPFGHDEDCSRAIGRAYALFRWFDDGWKVNAELPGTDAFAAASSHVRPEDELKAIPGRSPVEQAVRVVHRFTAAGFTDVALVQIGVRSRSTLMGRRRAPGRPTEQSAVHRLLSLFSLLVPASKFRR